MATDGVAHLGTVQRVEVEILHLHGLKFHHVHRNVGTDQLASFRIVIQTLRTF